jgi:hypothetical protein
MRERNGASKSNVLTSGSPVANPIFGPDYSVFIRKYFSFHNFTYPHDFECHSTEYRVRNFGAFSLHLLLILVYPVCRTSEHHNPNSVA